MATKLYFNAFVPAFSNLGVPIAQSKLYFYYTNTTTLAPVFADAAATVPLANPVQANIAGKYPDVYLSSDVTYRVVQTDALGGTIGDAVDPYIPGFVAQGAPGGNVESIGTFSAGMTPIIGAGTTQVTTSGTTRGRFIYNAALTETDRTNHPLAIFKAADGRFFQRDPRELIWLNMFNPDPTGVADSQPALAAALAYCAFVGRTDIPTNFAGRVCPDLHVDFGRYRLATRTNVKATVRIIGRGGWHELSNNATIFICEDFGLIFNRGNTDNLQGPIALTTGSDGSVVRNIRFSDAGGRATWTGDQSQRSLIHAQCAIEVADCYFEGAPVGLSIEANTDGSGRSYGEASQSRITGNIFSGCYIGFYAGGIDSNVHDVRNNTFSFCSMWGALVNSLLALKFDNNHYKGCGMSDEWGVGIVTYNGSRWQPKPGVSQARLGAEAPGTTDAWGFAETAFSPASNEFPAWPVTMSSRPATGRFYKVSGPVRSTVSGNSTMFLQEYRESGQPRPVIDFPGTSVGSNGEWQLATFSTGGYVMTSSEGNTSSRGFISGGSLVNSLGFTLYSSGDQFGWGLNPNGNDFRWTSGGSDSYVAQMFTGRNTTRTYGRSAPQPYKSVFPEIVLGDGFFGRTNGPPSDNGGVGEFRLNNSFTPGGVLGYAWTSSGWKAVGTLAT